MLDSTEIMINRIAQDKVDIYSGTSWFDLLPLTEKRLAISLLVFYIRQAHPDQNARDLGIDSIPLKPTMTPIVIFRTSSFETALNKIAHLPDYELKNSFMSLATVFKHADQARREISCKGGCSHEWHNLDKPQPAKNNFIKRLLKRLRLNLTHCT
jgi:hypothetical protein